MLYGHYHRETRANTRLAGHFNPSPMLFHNLLDDGKPDSGAGFSGFFRLFGAVKLLKDLLDFLLIHADALVLHGDADVAIVPPAGDPDFGPLGGILHRVGK